MRWVLLMALLACSPLVLSWRNQSGVRIGTGRAGSQAGGVFGKQSGRGGSGIKLGSATRNITTPLPPPTAPSTIETPTTVTYHRETAASNQVLQIGLVLPHQAFLRRDYNKAVSQTITSLIRSSKGQRLLQFKKHELKVELRMMISTPSPTGET